MLLRNLYPQEKRLVSHLTETAKDSGFTPSDLDDIKVSEMEDGGMGSLLFHSSDSGGAGCRMFGRAVSECSFHDEDGILVIATLHVDQKGELFELDMWKVNFGKLVKIPSKFQTLD